MAEYSVIVPEASPSLNKWAYSHWRKQHTAKSRWMAILSLLCFHIPKANGKRRLTIERYGKRRVDVDNIIGGAKSCITDNLRKLGLLLDDDDESVEFVARNCKLDKGQKPFTKIILTEI